MSVRRIFAVLAIIALGCDGSRGQDKATGSKATPTSAGEAAGAAVAAPDLRGEKSDGGSFTLRDVSGDPTLLVFFRGSFCGLCRERLEQLSRDKSSYDDLHVKIVAVTLDAPAAAETMRKDLKVDFPVVSAQPEVFRAWGIWQDGEPWPRTAEFMLGADGKVRFGRVGASASDGSSGPDLLAIARAVAQQ
jgi:peroxiredoxin